MASTWLAWAVKCMLAGGSAVTAACYLKNVSTNTAPGKARLLAATPVLALYTFLPLIFHQQTEMLSRGSCAAMLMWLANFKVLLLVMNRGPLSDTTLRLDQFVALLLWPVLPQEGPDGRPARVPADMSRAARRQQAVATALWRLPENAIIAAIGAVLLVQSWVPLFVKAYAAAFGVCAYCGVWANAARGLVLWAHGLECNPSWDRPWLQNCLSDFWSRRWNLPAAYSLRALVFEPFVEGSAVKRVVAQAPVQPADTGKASQQTSHMEPAAATEGLEPAGATNHVNGNGNGNGELVDVERVQGPDGTPAFKATVTRVDRDTQSGPQETALHNGRSASAVAPEMHQAMESAEKLAKTQSKEAGSSPAASQAQGAGRRRISPMRRLAALTATFAVSGAMHEALLLLVAGWKAFRPVAGLLMIYFMMQVPLSIVEQRLSKGMKAAKVRVPNLLAIVITSLTLQVPGLFLFWHPIWDAATKAMTANTA